MDSQTDPRKISKGKIYLVLSLYLNGRNLEEIHPLTRCPQATLQQYFQAFQQGWEQPDMTPYLGKPLTVKALCQLHAIAKKKPKFIPNLLLILLSSYTMGY